jgi:hypothetical protein
MADASPPKPDSRSEEAVEFMRLVNEADSFNRAEALEDLKFRFGDQWPAQMIGTRQLEEAPILTINETDSYCRQVVNHIRQQRPRGRAHPVNNTADVKTAKVITGIGRHIETHSDAANAYDLAAEFAVTIGKGYWRVRNDYIADDSFDQDIYVDQVENPFAVYFDPNSTLPDGSDQDRCLITDLMRKETFRKLYPSAAEQPFREGGSGDMRSMDWLTKEDIRLAEYFSVEKAKADLIMLSDGTVIYEDRLPSQEILQAVGLTIKGTRPSWRRTVKWSKVTCFETLEEKTLPGRWIPVVPAYGVHVIIEGKRRWFGMVRFARDPQRIINYSQTALVEYNAMAPKAKWLVPEGADEGHENEYAQANIRRFPVLRFKTRGLLGEEIPPPERVAPEPAPAGMLELAMTASQNLQRVLGMFDPVNLKHTGPKSGEAVRQETMQSEQSNYHFYDNLCRSINHTWRIFLNWTPEIYDTPNRVLRVIGDDGKPDLVTINQTTVSEGVEKVLNDVRVGDYDVVMETGPGFNTKRQESLQVFTEMLQTPLGEMIAKVGADLIVRMVDADGAETLADRLAASNPMAQIDEHSEIPPRVQMQIKQLQAQVQEKDKMLQAASIEIKSRQSVAEIKEHGAILREHIKQRGEKEEREVTRAQKAHDTETYALTAQHVAEINALAKILTSKTEHAHRLREMLIEFEHEENMQEKDLKAKSEQTEPEKTA